MASLLQYLPREYTLVVVTVVHIPPNVNTNQALDKLHGVINRTDGPGILTWLVLSCSGELLEVQRNNTWTKWSLTIRASTPETWAELRNNKDCKRKTRRMSWGVLQPEERSCSVFWWYGSRYFSINCQTAAEWTGCCWGGCLLISFGLCACTSPHQYH